MSTMANALASRRGELVLSYQSFDVIDNRELFPAPLLLQIYRQMKADPLLDYSDFLSSLGEPVGYSCGNADPLDEVEWWLCINKAGELFEQTVVRATATATSAADKSWMPDSCQSLQNMMEHCQSLICTEFILSYFLQ